MMMDRRTPVMSSVPCVFVHTEGKTIGIEVAFCYYMLKKWALFCYTESHSLELQDASLLFVVSAMRSFTCFTIAAINKCDVFVSK